MNVDFENSDLTINDALALLLGWGLFEIRRRSLNVLHMFEADIKAKNDSVRASRKSDTARTIRGAGTGSRFNFSNANDNY